MPENRPGCLLLRCKYPACAFRDGYRGTDLRKTIQNSNMLRLRLWLGAEPAAFERFRSGSVQQSALAAQPIRECISDCHLRLCWTICSTHANGWSCRAPKSGALAASCAAPGSMRAGTSDLLDSLASGIASSCAGNGHNGVGRKQQGFQGNGGVRGQWQGCRALGLSQDLQVKQRRIRRLRTFTRKGKGQDSPEQTGVVLNPKSRGEFHGPIPRQEGAGSSRHRVPHGACPLPSAALPSPPPPLIRTRLRVPHCKKSQLHNNAPIPLPCLNSGHTGEPQCPTLESKFDNSK